MPADFLDTNVVVYITSGEPYKAARARDLLDGGIVISVQVLNELAHVLRRKFRYDWIDVWSVTASPPTTR